MDTALKRRACILSLISERGIFMTELVDKFEGIRSKRAVCCIQPDRLLRAHKFCRRISVNGPTMATSYLATSYLHPALAMRFCICRQQPRNDRTMPPVK